MSAPLRDPNWPEDARRGGDNFPGGFTDVPPILCDCFRAPCDCGAVAPPPIGIPPGEIPRGEFLPWVQPAPPPRAGNAGKWIAVGLVAWLILRS
jgi:hypothetical protein